MSTQRINKRRSLQALFALLSLSVLATPCWAQLGSGSLRPFVTGWIPVVGPGGAVGGILVDSKGVVRNATAAHLVSRRAAAEKALIRTPADLTRNSPLRMVSLKQIDAAIAEHLKSNTPLSQDILFLGGMTRVRYVFVDLEAKDIILAGPGESWRADNSGRIVGRESGQPVLRLEDLLIALRCAADGEVATCSIDPSQAGSQKLQKLLSTRKRFSPALKRHVEKAVGPQEVTIGGVAPTTRFAHVMLAADVQMKRLAMQLEKNPPERPRGYLQMLHESGKVPRNAAPRWWIAPDYESITHSEDQRVWRIEGAGIRVVSEDGFTSADGRIIGRGDASSTTSAWSKEFNDERKRLVDQYPIFAELRNCIDLSVAAAIIWTHNLQLTADCELPNLIDNKRVQAARRGAPKQIASVASLMPSGSDVIIAVSGGVEIDAWKIAERTKEDKMLGGLANQMLKRPKSKRWVWD